jgi:toxin ParE1/3/4
MRSCETIRLRVARIRFLSTAKADLIEIRRFSFEEFGADVADAYFLGFKKAFGLLRNHPLAGSSQAELGQGIRCYVHRSHRIFYSIEDDLVLIRRIVHHSRDAKRAFN